MLQSKTYRFGQRMLPVGQAALDTNVSSWHRTKANLGIRWRT